MSSGNSQIKATLRAAHRQRRSGCDPMDPGFARQLTTLPAWQQAGTVAAYLGYGSEPRVTHLLQEAVSQGRRILLPILQADQDLAWTAWDGDLDHLERRGNVLEPRGPGSTEAIVNADLVITPALAVDRRGHRLGQGGGSFDRALLRATSAVSVAVIYDHDLVDELPFDDHDQRVDFAITPTRTIAFN